MKKIEEYTADELSAKIEAIKVEREKTADALKKYEEELERRKKFPLGAPIGGAISRSFLLWFPNIESADKFDNEYFTNFIGALQDIAEGKQIDIKVLLPLLPKGHWVACDSSGEWFVFSRKPFIRNKVGSKEEGIWDSNNHAGYFGHLPFNLKPADDWQNSLMECGL